MDCFIMNERLYNALSGFMERKDDSEGKTKEFLDQNIETRKNHIELAKHLYSSESSLSEYKDKFNTICQPLYITERKEMFDQLFKNYGYGNEFFMDHQGMIYDGNHVTTQDLTMNHLKKNICGPIPRKFCKGKYLPEMELTAIYPNLTKWGLSEKLNKITNEPTCKQQPQVSEYKHQFGCNG